MKINPILIKELKIRARAMRIPIFVMLYVVLMAFVTVFMLLSLVGMSRNGGNQYHSLSEMFTALGMVQCLMACLVSLVCGAGSFSNEKERGTLDMLLMTPVRSYELVNGKLFSAAITGCFFVFAAMPVLALGTIYGGADLNDLFFLAAVIVMLSFVCSAEGVFCSIICGRSSVAMICTIALFCILNFGPFVVSDFMFSTDGLMTAERGAIWVMTFLFMCNPMMLYYEFYDRVTGAGLMMSKMGQSGLMLEETAYYDFLSEYFFAGCVAVQIVVLLLFVLLSIFVLKKLRNVR